MYLNYGEGDYAFIRLERENPANFTRLGFYSYQSLFYSRDSTLAFKMVVDSIGLSVEEEISSPV